MTREQVQAGEADPTHTYAPADTNGQLRAIPEGRAGIAATLDFMVELTKQYRTNAAIRQLAENIVRTIPGKDYYGEAERIQEWVRSNVRYTQDVFDVETVKNPLLTATSQSGDCDDMALLAGTLLNTLGHPVRYVAVGTAGPDLDHVYVETKVNQRWMGVETTEDVGFGWTPQPQFSRMVRNV